MPASQEARDPRHQPVLRGEGPYPAQRQPPGGGHSMAPGQPWWPGPRGREAWAGRDLGGAWFTTGNRFTQSIVHRAGLLPAQRSQVCPRGHHAACRVRHPAARDPGVPRAVRSPAAHLPVHWVLPIQWNLCQLHPITADPPNRQPRHQCSGLGRRGHHSIPALPAGGLFHSAGQHGQSEPDAGTQG
ncbi:ataxin 1 [Homo sapiens]|uniref:Ataxin 1 n=1 Tax=Homo sapiens TaxID=9606 RepID=A0A2R8YCF3_HUMAN|nr:ataxin-1 isoform Alt-ATXN1 [Homo sapiens]KAI4016913.1 ataxin 1 [Homo sapiens]|eukprot:NP_001344786.1 ataxin-1 Alt-ATXN1 [Homo sapiens]